MHLLYVVSDIFFLLVKSYAKMCINENVCFSVPILFRSRRNHYTVRDKNINLYLYPFQELRESRSQAKGQIFKQAGTDWQSKSWKTFLLSPLTIFDRIDRQSSCSGDVNWSNREDWFELTTSWWSMVEFHYFVSWLNYPGWMIRSVYGRLGIIYGTVWMN